MPCVFCDDWKALGRSRTGLLSVQRQPVDHAHRHRHVPELTCDFNSSIDLCIASYLVVKKAWLCADADELRLSETTLGSSAVKVLVNFITASENVVSELARDLVN